MFYLAGVHEKRFKAFVAHCGVYNTISEYGSTEEYWYENKDDGGAPWDKPQPPAFNKFSPQTLIDKWDTPILIITGMNDFRIPYTQSMEAFNSAQLRGVPSKLLIFENRNTLGHQTTECRHLAEGVFRISGYISEIAGARED